MAFLLLPDGKRDGESGALAGRAREVDLAAVQLDEALGKRKAEAVPSALRV